MKHSPNFDHFDFVSIAEPCFVCIFIDLICILLNMASKVDTFFRIVPTYSSALCVLIYQWWWLKKERKRQYTYSKCSWLKKILIHTKYSFGCWMIMVYGHWSTMINSWQIENHWYKKVTSISTSFEKYFILGLRLLNLQFQTCLFLLCKKFLQTFHKL